MTDNADYARLITKLGEMNAVLVDRYHVAPLIAVDTVELLEDSELALDAIRATAHLTLRLASQLRGL